MEDKPLTFWHDPQVGIEWKGSGHYALNREIDQSGIYHIYSRNDESLYREYWNTQKLIEFVGYDKVANILVKACEWHMWKFFDEEAKFEVYAALDQVTTPK